MAVKRNKDKMCLIQNKENILKHSETDLYDSAGQEVEVAIIFLYSSHISLLSSVVLKFFTDQTVQSSAFHNIS